MNGIVMSCYGKATTTWDKRQSEKRASTGKKVFPRELELTIPSVNIKKTS
jgi:hypothetical protein